MAVHVDVPFQVELCGETLSTGVTVVNCLKREIMLSFSDFEKNMISYTIKHTILHEGGSEKDVYCGLDLRMFMVSPKDFSIRIQSRYSWRVFKLG